MLYMIGLGLGDERDITLRGLDAVKRCSKARRHGGFTSRPPTRARRRDAWRGAHGRNVQVYLEAYTSILGVDTAKLARATPR
jgi:diphthamide biosynthesis methyltransferase